MRIWKGWILIESSDSINLVLNYKSIKQVQKHFVTSSRRSFMHYEKDCAFCQAKVPLRSRFVAEVIFEDKHLYWEYGDEVQKQIVTMVPFVNTAGYLQINVMRMGKYRDTFYRCTHIESHDKKLSVSKYTSGKYGHMVRR